MPATANVMTSMSRSPDHRRPTCSTISSSAGTRRASARKPTAHGATTRHDRLDFPARLSAPRGASVVQIQRMVHPGRYGDAHPSPESQAHDISGGERSILEQYLGAIGAARSSIYIENQAIPVPQIATALEAALARGVEVVVLVPAEPEHAVRAARLRCAAQASLRWPRRARPASKLCAGRDCGPRCARAVAIPSTSTARSCWSTTPSRPSAHAICTQIRFPAIPR